MNEIDRWVNSGAEPEHIRPLLDALRDLPPAPPVDKEQMARRISEMLDAELSRSAEASVATTTPIAPAPSERPASEAGVTVRSPQLDERAVAAPPPPELLGPVQTLVPSQTAQVREPRPAEGRPPEELMITRVSLDLPAEFWEQMGRLPFRRPEPAKELTRTMKVPEWNPRQGQTAALGDDSIQKVVAALPFDKSPVGAAVVPFPRLSLQEYASLRAELWVWPERSDEIRRRYYVMNEAARRVLEEHWQAELAASPEARAQFEKAFADYTAWLRTQRV